MKPKFSLLIFLSLMWLTFAGCQSAADEVLTVTMTEEGFVLAEPLPSGIVTVEVVNEGKEPHLAQFLRLNDGVTMEAFDAAAQKGDGSELALVTAEGGSATLGPGQKQQVVLDLATGNYVLIDFVGGLFQPFEITTAGTDRAAPTADRTITLQDFSFNLSDDIQAGEQMWQIVNKGPQVHEMALIRLNAGTTAEDIANFATTFEGAPPYADMGGMMALSVDHTGWVKADLQPGEYAFICLVPDSNSGAPHATLGMVHTFTVR